MNARATTISVTFQTAELLQAKAAMHRLSLDEYLRRLAETDVALTSASPKPRLDEFDHDMDELAAGLEGLPMLAEDFSRADLYADHD
jgi:hypothetical protein